MSYTAHEKVAWLLLFYNVVSMLSLFSLSKPSSILIIYQAFIFMMLLLSFLLRYHLHISQQQIQFNAALWRWSIAKRTLEVTNIKMIMFRRVGILGKCAYVIPHHGRKLRLAFFKGGNWLLELEQFAQQNNIAIDKSADYRFVENS